MKICLVCEGISETPLERCASCGMTLLDTEEVHYPLRRGEEEAANPLLGTVIDGKYRITGVVGKGGMGTVFAAVHEVALVPVALKILQPRWAERADHRRHFIEEARKAGRVNHEHSARILDVGEAADGTVYLAMELVDGITLADWMRTGQRPGLVDLLDILEQISRAMAASHAAGVVHRDLTPRNVMVVSRDGRPFVKVLDFGIAKGSALGAVMDDTGSSGPRGFANPPYSAPEHIEGGEVDARADLYSLGVIAYELLTGRLPVPGRTPRELAKATVDGRLEPLRAPARTPKLLVRLVWRLLSRDPARRPSGAGEVIAEIVRIRSPRWLGLRAAAATALLATVPSFALAHVERPEVFLRLVASGPLELFPDPPALDSPAQELTSASLDELRFYYGGFLGTAMEVNASAGGVVERGRMAPRVEAGQVVLSRAASPEYGAFLDRLAGLGEPVTLEFRPPGRAPLLYGRVQIDDAPPVIELGCDPTETVLSGDTLLRHGARDDGTLASFAFEVSWRDGDRRRQVDVNCDGAKGVDRAAALLGSGVTGVRRRQDVEVGAVASDRAGNRARAKALRFAAMDLAAPAVVAARGQRTDDFVGFGPDGAELSIELDQNEPGLTLVVTPPGDAVPIEAAIADGERIRQVTLEVTSGGEPPASGPYRFAVRDRAGNLGAPLTVGLRMLSKDARPVLEARGAEGHAVVVAAAQQALIVTDGTEVELGFGCNELYRPKAASFDGRPAPAMLRDAAPGRARLVIPALAQGRHGLAVELVDAAGARVEPARYDLVVVPEPLELRLPDTGGRRFLDQLVDLDVIARRGERVEQGAAWTMHPDEPGLVRGTVWFGRPPDLASRAVDPAQAARGIVFGGEMPRNGWNVVAVALRDVLGRPVMVRRGEAEAPPIDVGEADRASEVARFVHAVGDVRPRVDQVRVEFDQPARVVVRSPLPLEAGDVISLRVREVFLSPSAVVTVPGVGAELRFSVPWKLIAENAQVREPGGRLLGDLDQAAVARGVTALMRGVRLETPAGADDIDIEVRTIRSSLRSLRCGALAGNRPVPAALAGMVMVPVLAPDEGVFADPVLADTALRGSFRPQPPLAVRVQGDLFLQQGELTRAQYQALVDAFAALPAGVRDLASVVHPWDPQGPGRLGVMRPLAFADDAAWRDALEAGPNRPVTGVSFFQAHTAARMAGVVVGGDPDLFRLPLGFELEMAALAAAEPGAMNGVGAHAPSMTVRSYLELGGHSDDLGRWPPDVAALKEHGDLVRLRQNDVITGLDFGVREWVLDLPYLPTAGERAQLEAWITDAEQHLARAQGGVSGPGATAPGLLATFARIGVVRGTAVGEVAGLVDIRTGARPDDGGVLSMGVPGVVRTLFVHRDGRGALVGDLDPNLPRTGFRLAGGGAFVERVRQ